MMAGMVQLPLLLKTCLSRYNCTLALIIADAEGMPEQWISAGSNRSSGIRTFEKRSSR